MAEEIPQEVAAHMLDFFSRNPILNKETTQ